jgi:RNA-splicing ligase RtcB
MQHSLADALYGEIPADVGSKGSIALEAAQYGAMLMGARWALEQGWGEIVSRAHRRKEEWRATRCPDGVGSRLGSGNHYLEVQTVIRSL